MNASFTSISGPSVVPSASAPSIALLGTVESRVPLAEGFVTRLRAAGFRVVRCRNWTRFVTTAGATQAAVAVFPNLASYGAVSSLSFKLRPEELPCPLVLVTSNDPDNLRHLATIRVARVVYLNELEKLPQAVISVAMDGGRGRLRDALRAREMPLTLKRTLLWLVDQPAAQSPVERGQPECLPHTADELGRLTRLSGSYLRQLACKAGVPLGKLIRRNLALRGLEMLAVGIHAQETALRLGYDSADGLFKLVRRNFGKPTADVVASGLDAAYEETAALFQPLESPGR